MFWDVFRFIKINLFWSIKKKTCSYSTDEKLVTIILGQNNFTKPSSDENKLSVIFSIQKYYCEFFPLHVLTNKMLIKHNLKWQFAMHLFASYVYIYIRWIKNWTGQIFRETHIVSKSKEIHIKSFLKSYL